MFFNNSFMSKSLLSAFPFLDYIKTLKYNAHVKIILKAVQDGMFLFYIKSHKNFLGFIEKKNYHREKNLVIEIQPVTRTRLITFKSRLSKKLVCVIFSNIFKSYILVMVLNSEPSFKNIETLYSTYRYLEQSVKTYLKISLFI